MPHPPPSVVNHHHALSQSGTRVSGILHKWVNCGKGWRPRWFVLQDGVLSYYKIHSPVVIKETNEECRVIGSHSSHNHHHVDPRHHKPLGELHLKVSSICESKSDDRKFSIFTGTKGLHLKASTHEDQMEWMEALNAAKRMFPRMSNSELMNPVTNFTLSTELLRLRLLKEGVDEAIIQDAESIMRDEFSTMQDELVLLQKKVGALVDTLGIS